MNLESLQKYKVSVIVPLYNQKRFLESCIRSICNQTHHNLEIIIVNDGSTDDSLTRALRLSEKDERIKVYDKPNEGVAYARRDGYKKATGEFLAFVDNDDLLPRTAIEKMLRCIVQNGVDLVIGDTKRILGPLKWDYFLSTFPKNQVVSQPELYEKYYDAFFGNAAFPINVWGRLYRKEAIDRAAQNTELYSQEIRYMADDLYMNMKLFPYLKSMMIIEDVVYFYRYGGTVDHFNRNYTEVLTLSDLRIELLEQQHKEDYSNLLFVEYVNMVYYHAQQLLEFKRGNKDDVIAFFKNELTKRAIVPKLKQYYERNKTENNEIRLLMNGDYEGMYNHAYELTHQRCDRFEYKIKRLLLSIIERLV